MRIISYNVNGIRAAQTKGLADWLKKVSPDVVCFQEIKALETDVPKEVIESGPYHAYWYPAEKKGYSGVGILSKTKPKHVEYGCGISEYDREGRVLRADFKDFSVMSVYCPSGTTGGERQEFKEKFMTDFRPYAKGLTKRFPNLVISGDFNICHKEIDIHNPVSNKNSSGFLPHEREWLGEFLDTGFTDSFRHLNADPHNYTWWSYRSGARARNLGWRIDYHMVSKDLTPAVQGHRIFSKAMHSDHCPMELELSF